MRGVWGPADVMRDTDGFSYGFVSPLLSSPHPNLQILLTPPQVVCACVYVYVCLNGLSQRMASR